MKKSTGCYVIECDVKINKKIACISEILLFFVCKDISELLKVQRNLWNLKHNYNSKIIWHKIQSKTKEIIIDALGFGDCEKRPTSI